MTEVNWPAVVELLRGLGIFVIFTGVTMITIMVIIAYYVFKISTQLEERRMMTVGGLRRALDEAGVSDDARVLGGHAPEDGAYFMVIDTVDVVGGVVVVRLNDERKDEA